MVTALLSVPFRLPLLDIQAKRLGVPLSEVLGGRLRNSLPVLWTLASGDTKRYC